MFQKKNNMEPYGHHETKHKSINRRTQTQVTQKIKKIKTPSLNLKIGSYIYKSRYFKRFMTP